MSNYLINGQVTADNAVANGQSLNSVQFTFIDPSTMMPAVGLDVVIQLTSGSGTILESNGTVYRTVSDGNGSARANIKDKIAEIVTVKCFVVSDQTQYANVAITFIANAGKIEITEAVNLNHSLTAGQPTVAWEGASFTLKTAGGSGDLSWSVSGATAEVNVQPDSVTRTAIVTIKSRPNQPCIITVKDVATGNTDMYIFTVANFLQAATDQPLTYRDASKLHPTSLPPIDIYETLFHEWGNIGAYGGRWVTGDSYWSSTEDGSHIKVINLQNGVILSESKGHKHVYAFLVGV